MKLRAEEISAIIQKQIENFDKKAVSYTHLTLPTKA